MILYYAVGGGLGHLTRARAVVQSLGLDDELVVLSASAFGEDPRILGNAHFVRVPMALATDLAVYRCWLREVIDTLSPKLMFIDAFPAGLFGEFCDLELPRGLQLYHVARLLRWERYEQRLRGALPQFEMSLCVEPLTEEHRLFLRQCSSAVVALELVDPPGPDATAERALLARLRREGDELWLVVHSAPSWETAQLYRFALAQAAEEGCSPKIVVVAPKALPWPHHDVTQLSTYPASALFPEADRIVTACGFNAMRQGLRWGSRHLFMPFSRSLDDQHLRAERQRRALITGWSHLRPLVESRPRPDGATPRARSGTRSPERPPLAEALPRESPHSR
jgi:hypothetical protein